MDEECFVVSHTRPTDYSGHKFTVDFDLSQGNAHCSICTNECGFGGESRVRLECNHSFHKDCIERWFKFHEERFSEAPSCPNCRYKPSNLADNTDNTDNTDTINTDNNTDETVPAVYFDIDNTGNIHAVLEFQRVIRRMNEYFLGEGEETSEPDN
jgi:hypothetical protein